MSSNEPINDPPVPEPKLTVGQRIAQSVVNIAVWPIIAVMTLIWRRKK